MNARPQYDQLPSTPVGGVAPSTKRVMNLAHFLSQAARRHPEKPALTHGSEQVTWQQLEQRAAALAHALQAQGIGKGDRVLTHSKNCIGMVVTLFATLRLGAVWVPTNFRISPDEAVYLAQASGVKAFFCHADFPEHAQAVAAAMPEMQQLICIDTPSHRQAPFGNSTLSDLLAEHAGQVAPEAAVEHDDPCWFFFTSGTTGKPKAAVLTHGQMAFVVTNHLCDLMPGTTAADVSLVVAPLSHGAGIHYVTQVARAVHSVLPAKDKMDCEEIWELVQNHRVTNMFTVPTIVKLLVEHPSVDQYDHSTLRYVIYAGAPMYREDQKYALQKLGPVLVQYFGLGEVTGNITVLPPAEHHLDDSQARLGTCGFERTGMQISIQGDDGQELAPGESGEICVCGPAVFAGYYNNPEANQKSFRNGWFRTGDLGYVDAQGYLFITGRQSDMYISGGSNIYPREIEEKVLTHPAIAEVAVLGIPDPTWGEVGVMVCVTRAEQSVSANEMIEWMAPKMARYKLPKHVFFWDELPRSGYGKITKKLVRETLYERGDLSTGN
ncbi:acyl-CoA synthetase [Comamonas sp. J-3]|uniref:acyl-CoA synthetase n=1 Tax=Comamonas trifloxystrobinivorans TaxID=3350256 RepID=UPI00372A1FC0